MIQTGGGKDTITASTGGDTIQTGGGADNISVKDHSVADRFVCAATSDSPNTNAGHDTITGFQASSTVRDVLDFSKLLPQPPGGLAIQGSVSSGIKIAADSTAWLYSGGNALVYVNDTASALATSNASLMEITLPDVSSGLLASDFIA